MDTSKRYSITPRGLRALLRHLKASGGSVAPDAEGSLLSEFQDTRDSGIDEARAAGSECAPSPGEAEPELEGEERTPVVAKRAAGVRHMARCGKCGTLVTAEQAKDPCPTCGQKLQVVVVGFAADDQGDVTGNRPQEG